MKQVHLQSYQRRHLIHTFNDYNTKKHLYIWLLIKYGNTNEHESGKKKLCNVQQRAQTWESQNPKARLRSRVNSLHRSMTKITPLHRPLFSGVPKLKMKWRKKKSRSIAKNLFQTGSPVLELSPQELFTY